MDMSTANKIKKPKLQTVVVLGASIKPQRYSYKAVKLLVKHKHRVIPVHPKLLHINDLAVTNSLSEIKTPVDTLTLYVGAERSRGGKNHSYTDKNRIYIGYRVFTHTQP